VVDKLKNGETKKRWILKKTPKKKLPQVDPKKFIAPGSPNLREIGQMEKKGKKPSKTQPRKKRPNLNR